MLGATPRFDVSILEELCSKLDGELITPGHERYDKARTVWNAKIDRRPSLIIRCANVADVVASVKFARRHNAIVSVRGGGHDIAGNGVCDGGVVIDISQMKNARVDPVRQAVRAQAGLTWAELDRYTQAFGLATTGGQCSSTGIAGVALGGGMGWLMRQHGLTIDNLISADIVTADGSFLTASEQENTELFWAIRGGGGNFGIVTELELRLHPVGEVAVGMMFYPTDRLGEALNLYRKFCETAPDCLGSVFVAGPLPSRPQIPNHLHGARGVQIVACYNGSIDDARKILKPLRESAYLVADIIEATSYPLLQSMFESSPAAAYGYMQCIRSRFIHDLDDDVVDAIVTHVEMATSPQHYFELIHLGGAVARIDANQTAFPRRDATFFGMFQSTWNDASESERHVSWARDASQTLGQFTCEGTYPNYIDGDEPRERVRQSFGELKMQRLVAVKRRYDPDNLFHMNKNIEP